MAPAPRICVLLPVFNHSDTVRRLVRASIQQFPLFVVDDGSDDSTAAVLNEESGFTLVRFRENQGKGAALQAGFRAAKAAGFSHVISIDADGQHFPEDLKRFEIACLAAPECFVVGQRGMKTAGAPWQRRFSNMLSSACFYLETGLKLRDTLCGYRVYPLAQTSSLHATAGRYAYELEVLVRAAWAGFEIRSIEIETDYRTASAQGSHFRPIRDFLSIARVHCSLLAERTGFAKRWSEHFV